MANGCPHTAAQFCPLYMASHLAIGVGCDDGRLEEGTCAVARGMKYGDEVAKVRAVDGKMTADLALAEIGSEIQKQRARNMRQAGIR
jgi:hypothetical protein